MPSRRRFIQALAATAAGPSLSSCHSNAADSTGFGELVADPAGILDLPAGFSYRVVSTYGDEMDDGLLVPARADGMAAFAGQDGRIIVVCNHENPPIAPQLGPFGSDYARLQTCDKSERVDSLLKLLDEEDAEFRPRLGTSETEEESGAASEVEATTTEAPTVTTSP